MLCFVVFVALFCIWLQGKPPLSVLIRGIAWMRLCFAPPNILSDTPSTL